MALDVVAITTHARIRYNERWPENAKDTDEEIMRRVASCKTYRVASDESGTLRHVRAGGGFHAVLMEARCGGWVIKTILPRDSAIAMCGCNRCRRLARREYRRAAC